MVNFKINQTSLIDKNVNGECTGTFTPIPQCIYIYTVKESILQLILPFKFPLSAKHIQSLDVTMVTVLGKH